MTSGWLGVEAFLIYISKKQFLVFRYVPYSTQHKFVSGYKAGREG